MKNYKEELIELLTKELEIYFGPKRQQNIHVEEKADRSFITHIDQLVSDFSKDYFKNTHKEFKDYHFYSEEDYTELKFPAVVLDPIDGTRELTKGMRECAVSLALMQSSRIDDPKNYAWIYNPFSGFELDSKKQFVQTANFSSQKLLGLVSRTEFHRGLFNQNRDDIQVFSPRGSIAFKLGLLASGGADFVISLNPKNIWDIAAGTILCEQRGISFYVNGEKKNSLDQEKYSGVLVWANEAIYSRIDLSFITEKAKD